MQNSNFRAEQYTELRRRLSEINSAKGSCPMGTCGLHNQKNMTKTPCNPEGENRGNGWGLYEYPLAMVYAPYQSFRGIYKCCEALERGTLFSELYLPFEGCK